MLVLFCVYLQSYAILTINHGYTHYSAFSNFFWDFLPFAWNELRSKTEAPLFIRAIGLKRFFCFFRVLNISIPRKTRLNGTLYAYVFVHPVSKSPFQPGTATRLRFLLTEYAMPKDQVFNLLTESQVKVR